MSALKRIRKELKEFNSEKIKNLIELKPINENNLFKCRATIIGPDKSPYEGGTFYLNINIPEDYPFKPPEFKFETKIYHPNVHPNGYLCLQELEKDWSPALFMSKILLTISSLLSNPNIEHPYNAEATNLYKKSKDEFYKKARDYAIIYADAPTNNTDFFYLKGKARIEYELNNIKYDKNIELTKEDSIYSFYKCRASIKGIKYPFSETRKLELFFDFPQNYPLDPFRFYISNSGYDKYLNDVEKICNIILKEKWERLFLVKDAIKLILKCLKRDFIKIIIDNKEDIELKEKINKLEDLLNIEKKEKQNLLQKNTKLEIKLKESEEIINNLLQENSNLNKKINELEEFSRKNFTYLSKNINNLENDKLITDNNLKNDYDKLMNNYNIILDDKNKLRKDYEDLKNHSNYNNNKIANKEKCVNFNSTDQTINYAIPCSGDSTFAEIEELLYKKYPDYRETNNIFLANGKEILRFKSINDNNIETGKPILLVKPL